MSDGDLGDRSERGTEYADLSRLVRDAGFLDRRPGRYALRVALVLGGLGVVGVVFVRLGQSWWQLVVAVVLGVLFAQVAFLGHDAGHRQIFRSRPANDAVGLACGMLTGISYGWWVDKHNRHHAHPNTEGHDPDIVVVPLSFTPGQAATRRGLGALFVRHQAALFFPLLLLEGFHLHVASVGAVVGRRRLRHRRAEAGLLAVHLAGYVTAVFLVMSIPQAIAFILVNQGLFGLYLGCSFAPNHKGMPILSEADNLDYLRRQVLTSRNVRGGRFLDAVLGGLNYQIEHHLFPSMPRPNLRRAQPLIRQFCVQHGIPYHETTLPRSWARALAHLRTIGTAPGAARRTV